MLSAVHDSVLKHHNVTFNYGLTSKHVCKSTSLINEMLQYDSKAKKPTNLVFVHQTNIGLDQCMKLLYFDNINIPQ